MNSNDHLNLECIVCDDAALTQSMHSTRNSLFPCNLFTIKFRFMNNSG